MLFQRFLGSIPHHSRLQNPCGFALLLLGKLTRLFLGNLFVPYTKRFPSINRHVTKPITQVVAPRLVNLPALSKPSLPNIKNHDGPPFTSICTSLNRKRTAPKTLIFRRTPFAVSRSIVRIDNASLSATSLFVTSWSNALGITPFISTPFFIINHPTHLSNFTVRHPSRIYAVNGIIICLHAIIRQPVCNLAERESLLVPEAPDRVDVIVKQLSTRLGHRFLQQIIRRWGFQSSH